jgi:type IV secretory system conjugative DNA transfer VirD4/TraG family protein
MNLPWGPKQTARWPLDMALFRIGSEPWRVRDSYEGVAILGANGSGKTSGSGRLLALKMLRAGYGGLVCCAKRSEAETWREYLKETGREEDGRFFTLDSDFRFNFIQHEAKTSGLGFTENLVNLLSDVASIKRLNQGANQAFWEGERQKLCRNTLALLLLAEQPITMQSIYSLIASSPRKKDDVNSPEWRKDSFLFRTMLTAEKLNGSHDEFLLVKNYFLTEQIEMHSGTSGTARAEFTGCFDPVRRGDIGRMYTTTTNISPDDILDGKIVIVDIPTDVWRGIGVLAQVIWVQMLQRAIDRRTYNPPNDRPVFMFQDEFQNFTIDSDTAFQARCRSQGLSVIRLAQNLPVAILAYGQDGRIRVEGLYANLSTKIFHRNDDKMTNSFAADCIGKEFISRTSVGSSNSGSQHTNLTQVEEYSCPPQIFQTLRSGGPANNHIVSGVFFQAGRTWGHGDKFVIGEFDQKRQGR